MSFLDWLALSVKRDDSVGDIARKVLEDTSYPVFVFDVYSIHEDVLRRRGASKEDIRSLQRAWREYTRKYRSE